jgi:hypothetical protein
VKTVVVQTWIWSFLRPSYVNDAPPVRVTYVHIWNTTRVRYTRRRRPAVDNRGSVAAHH